MTPSRPHTRLVRHTRSVIPVLVELIEATEVQFLSMVDASDMEYYIRLPRITKSLVNDVVEEYNMLIERVRN